MPYNPVDPASLEGDDLTNWRLRSSVKSSNDGMARFVRDSLRAAPMRSVEELRWTATKRFAPFPF